MKILLIKNVQAISAKMNYVLFTQILLGEATSGTFLNKRRSRTCG